MKENKDEIEQKIEEMAKIVCQEKSCSIEYCHNVTKYPNRFICLTRNGLEALYDAGYRKTDIKTNGGKFRSMSDEDFAGACIVLGWNEFANARCYISILTHCVYDTYEEAYKANLDWLKQEYNGEKQ